MAFDLHKEIARLYGDFHRDSVGIQITVEDTPILLRDEEGKVRRDARGLPLVDPSRYHFDVRVAAMPRVFEVCVGDEYRRIQLPGKRFGLRHTISRRAMAAFRDNEGQDKMKFDLIRATLRSAPEWRELHDYDPRAGMRARFSEYTHSGIPLVSPLPSFPLLDSGRVPYPMLLESRIAGFGQVCHYCEEGFAMAVRVPIWAGARLGWVHGSCWP